MPGKCPQCGAPVENGRCGYCGYTIPETSFQAAPVSNDPQTVPVQNNYIPPATPASADTSIIYGVSQKKKTVALLLCIFLGYLGAHKFYVGKIGGGLLYLFTAGLFGIGWFIDIIVIATGHFKDDFGLALEQ